MELTKVLFITTSHNTLGDTEGRTGLWLEEIAAPYYVFKEAGAELTVASPMGGLVPLDPKSQSIMLVTKNTKRFMKDQEAMNFLATSIRLTEVEEAEYDIVFITGGHGPMWDLFDNKTLNEILEAFYRKNKVIGSVCHGIVGLLCLNDEKGDLVINGKQITCFSNSEEGSTGLSKVVPFLLETALRSTGALYSKGPDYLSHVVADGNIITGQNAASSEELAKKIVASSDFKKQKPVYNIRY
jgi:putative intracellular protease/amidase